MAAETIYARLKPYNPKRGLKLKRYSVFGILFVGERGWYKVDADVAQYLKTVRQDNNDPDSKDAFDVCSESEMKKVVEDERRAKLKQGEAENPVDVAMDAREKARAERQAAAAKRARAVNVGDPKDAADAETVLTTDELPGDETELTDEVTDEATGDELPPPDDEPPPPDDSTIPSVEVTPDDLTKIDGVGEATEQKLYEAGLKTYAAVANADLAQLTELVGSRAKDVKKQAKKLGG